MTIVYLHENVFFLRCLQLKICLQTVVIYLNFSKCYKYLFTFNYITITFSLYIERLSRELNHCHEDLKSDLLTTVL